MGTLSNKAIVDRCVDILANQFRITMRNSYQNNGMIYNGNVDFSGLSEQIMAELENGNTNNIESIINRFVGEKIQNFDKVAGEKMSKRGYTSVHRNIVTDLMTLGKNLNGKCAEAIIKNVTIEKTETILDDSEKNNKQQFTNLNNGNIVEVTPDMVEKAADDFSEGNETLKELLTFCFENDIKTTACCSGHNGQKMPYIQFEFNDKNMQPILKMLKQLSLEDAISNLTFRKQPGVTSNFCISMMDDKYNEGFKQILEALKYEKKVEISEIDKTRQLIVKSLQNHNISNSYLEIQEENDSVAIGVGDEYLTIFTPEQEIRPWTEGTQLVECKKDSSEANISLSKLESKTKNRGYLEKHPYNKEKIDEFWRKSSVPKAIEINPVATLERQREYGEKNIVIINVSAGSTIESVAEQIMELHQYGQGCIAEFNSFMVDSRDFTNPDEVIQAYMQRYEKQKSEREVSVSEIKEVAEGEHMTSKNGAKKATDSAEKNIEELSHDDK